MSNIKCEMCGKNIDRSACGQTYGVHTTEIDINERHSQRRVYLCGYCNLKVESVITDEKYAREQREIRGGA